MKKIFFVLIGLMCIVGLTNVVRADVNAVTPNINGINKVNYRAHVNQLSQGIQTTDLEFISHRNFYSCFEYRTDGDVSQKTGEINYNSAITDGLYPFVCVNNNSLIKTISANNYVEVRMVFGAETDERFDWTRFDVAQALTAPEITGFKNPDLSCGAITNIHSTTVDWTDSTGGVGGVVGYDYSINYPLVNGSGQGDWNTFVLNSQRSGSLNEGVHTIKVRAKDSVGNVSDWSNECLIIADWTAPDVVITNPAEDSIVFGVVDVRGSITDAHPHHYWLAIFDANSGEKVAGPGTVMETESLTDASLLSWNTTQVPNGDYLIKLEARDAANNKDDGSLDWHYVTVNNLKTKDQCKKGGWVSFANPKFKNQGDCVSWLESNENAKGNKKNN